MTTAPDLGQTIGQDVYDVEGQKVGTATNLYASDRTGQPEWVTVRTGWFGAKESFVPLAGAHTEPDGLHVGAAKDLIKDAPRIDDQGHLSEAEAAELYRHYHLESAISGWDQRTRAEQGKGRTDQGKGRTKAGKTPAAGTDDRSMVRHEEHLRAGTETVETGRVRLHKYVVTEEEQVTVPVSHEEVRVVREPMNEADGGAIGEEDREVVLHEERPVVAKDTVAVERVGLDTETVREDQQITEQVRKEQIEVEDPTKGKRRKH